MYCLNFLKKIDIFSQPFNFNNKYSSTFGGFSTFLYIILALFSITYYFRSVFKFESPSINYFVISKQSNLLSEVINDTYIEVHLSSPVFTSEMRSKFILSAFLRKKSDNTIINVPFRNCTNPSLNQTLLCYRFYFEDYKIYYETFNDDLDTNLKLSFDYKCGLKNCQNDSYYRNNILKSSLKGYYIDHLFSPTEYDAPLNKFSNQFISEIVNSKHFSSYNLKVKKLILIDDDGRWLDKQDMNDIKSVNIGLERTFQNNIYYEDYHSEYQLTIMNFNIDFFTETADYLFRNYVKIPDALAKIMGILNAFSFIITVLTIVITDKKRNLALINKIYDFYDENEKINISRSKKFLERKSMSMINLKENLLPMTDIVTEDMDDEVKIIDQTLDLNESYENEMFENRQSQNKTNHSKTSLQFKKLIKKENEGKKLNKPNPYFKAKSIKKNTKTAFKMNNVLEKIDEENEEISRHNSEPNSIQIKENKSKNELRKMTVNSKESLNDNIFKDRNNSGNKRNNSMIGDILIQMNSKKKLTISIWEFMAIMCCFHNCSKNLKKKNDFYNQSVLKLQTMLNSNYMMEKLYEIEKIKYLLFNDTQNYAFSFLTKPSIVYTEESKTIVQNDIIKSRKDFKNDRQSSKEHSIEYLFNNDFNCSHINEKLFKLIKINNC